MKRSSGILLHITSLPGSYGIGTMGQEAFDFIDFLAETGQKHWQILPVNPTGFSNSPYQSFSAFAGNHLLISLENLVADGLLDIKDLKTTGDNSTQVDFDSVITQRDILLPKAYAAFTRDFDQWRDEYNHFLMEHSWWLDAYSLFIALKKQDETLKWNEWPVKIKQRDRFALAQAIEQHSLEVGLQHFVQFMFFRQWFKLKKYANEKGICIIGDLPLYVSYDSADVWANQDIFLLDEDGGMKYVGGVPPDAFSDDGQLWGCPVYDWECLAMRNYDWWIARFHLNLKMFDLLRIDHFRGMESFWAVPVDEETAINGEWLPAKGYELLQLLKSQISRLPLIAEDLGIITPEVDKLRTDFDLPGMKVLQFAFASDHTDKYLPHNYTTNFVVYTGTHDNDTLRGWLDVATEEEQENIKKYYGALNQTDRLIEAAWSSVAEMAVIPMQDLLELGSEARMNTPGTVGNNWDWRFKWSMLGSSRREFLKEITIKYNRV